MRFFYLNAPPAARTNWEKRAVSSARARAARPRVNIFIGEAGREGKEEKRRKNDRTTGYPSSNRAFSSLHFSSPLLPPLSFSLSFSFARKSRLHSRMGSHRRDGYLSRVNVGRETRLKTKTSSSPAFTGEFGKAGRGGK